MREKLENKQPFTLRYLILLGLVLVAGAIWFSLKSGFPSREIRHVLLISIDTCRADHLSCYGFGRKTTPNIDAIAQESILFKNALTPIPLTLPGHSSMLTGTIPPYHGIHDNEGYKLDQSHLTLAEILRRNGFTTGAIISAFVMDSQFGLDQGFDSYNDKFEEEIENTIINQRRGEEVSRFAINWLAEHKNEKFFLFLHYFDPHSRYEPPEPFATRFWQNLYAGEIAYADYCIGQVIKKLKELGLYDSALIIITSDHGEMLEEHGELTHGYFIYQSAIKVPLIVRLPGQRKSRVTKDLVGLIDIVPTVCNSVGIQTPPQVQGKDLSPYLRGKRFFSRDRHLYCESMYPTRYKANSLLGVVTDRWKYIQTTRPELYDLLKDPGETKNLTKQQSHRAHILQDRLREILEQTVNKSRFDSKVELDEESRKRLESLGYIAGTSVSEDFEFDKNKDDPKDVLDFHTEHGKISILILEKKYTEAKTICEKLLSQRPQLLRIHTRMGKIAVLQNNFAEAVTCFSKALALNPKLFDTHNKLAKALALEDKMGEAVKHYKKSLEFKSDQPATLDNLARLYSRQRKIEQAFNCWNRALQLEPDRPDVLNNLAWVKAVYKDENFYDPDEAVHLAQRACELTGYNSCGLLDTLATAYAAAGNFSDAIKTAEKALDIARSAEQNELAEQIQEHLELFKSGRPYRQIRQSKSTTSR